jgi:hypothetical protein
MAALDVEPGQVLIDFFNDDDGFFGHVRLLLVRLAAPGHWIVASPDLVVEVANLTAHRVILTRNAPIPPRSAGEVFFFDPVSPHELTALTAEVNALADVVLSTVAPGLATIVVAADPAHVLPGTAAAHSVVIDPLKAVVRDAVGLVRVEDDQLGVVWLHPDTSVNLLGGAFGKFVAEELKSEAFTLNQHHLFSDEVGQLDKKPGGGGPGAGGDGGGGAAAPKAEQKGRGRGAGGEAASPAA